MIRDLELYNQTDQQLHVLSQLLAKLSRSFVHELEDDSHTNLYFDYLGRRILGRWIATNRGNFLPSLNLKHFRFEFLNNNQSVIFSVPIVGHTITQIEEIIAAEISKFQLDALAFQKALHYKIPEYAFHHHSFSELSQDALKLWQHYRQLANSSCQLLLGHFQVEGSARIWPHHFDTGIYYELEHLGIGFGLAMKDSLVQQSYFYISAYPKASVINYDQHPANDVWQWIISDHWKGVVLSLEAIHGKSKSDQISIINSYLISAHNWYLKQHTNE
ncbi:MAG: hypothetical protein BM564_06455 [Bacteroidetes bacterium MedPE-SWsnd-G2]|nr:MAG: hypothetical protein BM564_06455 [Bacteroidetes bacterium MedPE-SWsnd-G2]